ncbi:unnamed protein product [Lactuca virosa]|uniref:Uncharacterized protein n=1 Tax=Lactuca virosa TaxID=75947 RepID=A0AAU9N0Y4_9ASTR|nr:unnamed protein product [Lactuca virosa]
MYYTTRITLQGPYPNLLNTAAIKLILIVSTKDAVHLFHHTQVALTLENLDQPRSTKILGEVKEDHQERKEKIPPSPPDLGWCATGSSKEHGSECARWRASTTTSFAQIPDPRYLPSFCLCRRSSRMVSWINRSGIQQILSN